MIRVRRQPEPAASAIGQTSEAHGAGIIEVKKALLDIYVLLNGTKVMATEAVRNRA
jgi:hypothetical protein